MARHRKGKRKTQHTRMPWQRYRGEDFFGPSRPRAAKGGIKARTKRGTFGENWWAKRWIGVLEDFNIGSRLSRGRSYARRGQVLSIDIEKGRVEAEVQGSRPAPYQVVIRFKQLPTDAWKKLAEVFSNHALFAAKLLAGEMPPDIEQAFVEAKLSLFPERLKDLRTDCSCPDWSNPCKHIAAVYYLLGEEFDRDPFLILKLRGITREELVTSLEDVHNDRARRKSLNEDTPAGPEPERPGPPEPLVSEASRFWNGEGLPEDLFGDVGIPPVSATLLKRLGSFPFWRGEKRFLETLEPIYCQASAAGVETFLGQRDLKTG